MKEIPRHCRYFFPINLILALSCCNKPGPAAAAPGSSTKVRDTGITMIELINEIDTTASAIQWVTAMIPYTRKIDGGIPVTIPEYDVHRMKIYF